MLYSIFGIVVVCLSIVRGFVESGRRKRAFSKDNWPYLGNGER